jgi:ABC-type phosphate/phosphonate transport system substrate-binding protein
MKRLFSLLLVFLICASVPAFAIDMTSLSNDELIQLRSDLADEMLSRGMTASMKIPTGDYIIGEDIPAGSYTVTTDQVLVSITVGDYESMYVLTPDSPIGKLSLEDGKKFCITSAVTLTKYTGLSFE